MKSFIKNFIIFILLIEIILQFFFYFEIKIIAKPIIFFNPYCDDRYWILENKEKNLASNKVIEEKFLTYINENKIDIFHALQEGELKIENENVFYGASFFDHVYFKNKNKNNNNIYNFSLNSYGIDQVYISFLKTIKNINNSNIILGLLLEDIDRAFLNTRDYRKNYKINIDNLKISKLDNDKENFLKTIYFYNFIKNIFSLYSNNFDPRNNECQKAEKIKLFSNIIKKISQLSEKQNNKLLVVTFNLEEDFNRPSWRHEYFLKELNLQKINHFDTLKFIKNFVDENKLDVSDLFGNDRHLNEIGFDLINDEISKLLSKEQYK